MNIGREVEVVEVEELVVPYEGEEVEEVEVEEADELPVE